VVRFDEALREIFGWERVASVSTYTRWFRRFKQREVIVLPKIRTTC
jgi:hypothetical protein